MTRRRPSGTGRAALLLALVGLCGCDFGPPPPWQAPPELPLDLRVAVDKTEVRLLEPIVVQLDLWRRQDVAVDFAPEVPREDFLVDTLPAVSVPFGDGVWQRTTLVLRPVRGPGDLVLPSFRARQQGGEASASTPERTITVASALADGDAGAAIEAPGEPFPAPPRQRWWLVGSVTAVWLLLLFWFGRSRGGARRPAAAVALPPHVKAQRALFRLRAAPRTTPAEVEAFYVQVSDVLRVYLEERFGLRAPERTTEEFLRDLEGGEALARGHRAELERFLSQCDLVKFAAARPTEPDHLATFALAEAFVATTAGDRQPTEVAS